MYSLYVRLSWISTTLLGGAGPYGILDAPEVGCSILANGDELSQIRCGLGHIDKRRAAIGVGDGVAVWTLGAGAFGDGLEREEVLVLVERDRLGVELLGPLVGNGCAGPLAQRLDIEFPIGKVPAAGPVGG